MLLDFDLKDTMNIKNSNKACDMEVVIFPCLSVVFLLRMTGICFLVWIHDLTAVLSLSCFGCHTAPIGKNA